MDFKIFQKNLDNFFLYSSRNIQNWIIRASSRFLGRCEHQPSCRESIKNDHLNRHRNNCVWTNTHTGSFNWDRQHYLVVVGFIVFGLSSFEIQRVLHSCSPQRGSKGCLVKLCSLYIYYVIFLIKTFKRWESKFLESPFNLILWHCQNFKRCKSICDFIKNTLIKFLPFNTFIV